MSETKKAVVFLNHAAVTLRVDDMVEEAMGIKVAKLAGEFTLNTGRNEVDADLWKKWWDNNQNNPLVTGHLVTEEAKQPEQQKEKTDGRSPKPK